MTPKNIVPEWYLLPFYASSLNPEQAPGLIALGVAILMLAFIPWLDTSRVRSCRFRPT